MPEFSDLIESAIALCTSEFIEEFIPSIPSLLNSDEFQKLLIEASDAKTAILVKPSVGRDETNWYISKSFDPEELAKMPLKDQLLMGRTYEVYVECPVRTQKTKYLVRCCWGVRNEDSSIEYVFLNQLVISKHGHIDYLKKEDDLLLVGHYFY